MAKNTNKKSSPIGMLILVILFAAVIVGVVVFNANLLFGQPKDLYDVIKENGEPIAGEYAELEVKATFGCYAETEYKIYSIIPAGKIYHYVALLDDGSVVSVSFKGKKMKEKFDDMLSNTQAYYISGDESLLKDTVTVKGSIKTVAGDQGIYYSKAMTGYFDGEIYRYSIDTTAKGSIFIVIIVLIAVEVGCVIGYLGAVKDKKKAKAAAEAGVQSMDVEQ